MPTTSRLFTESVTSGRQIAPSVEDGLSAAAVLDAAEQSALTKHWSQVPQIANQTSLWIPRMVAVLVDGLRALGPTEEAPPARSGDTPRSRHQPQLQPSRGVAKASLQKTV
ncbi:MAG: hypothetical protein QOG10_5067 [Kribbellaceae bacterium]|nr:hypothetical protein [Kribbellaceae bacterium]